MRVLILCLLVLGGPATAQQAFSKSMAECAGLMAFGADNVSDPDAVRIFTHGHDAYVGAARAQAAGEGRSDVDHYVDQAKLNKQQEWEDGGVMIVFSEEFGDWIDYCRAFAEAQGIELNPFE
ncbi:MAG: hypothetical protein AAFU41_08865 [Pseudomonadota bacterium]